MSTVVICLADLVLSSGVQCHLQILYSDNTTTAGSNRDLDLLFPLSLLKVIYLRIDLVIVLVEFVGHLQGLLFVLDKPHLPEN